MQMRLPPEAGFSWRSIPLLGSSAFFVVVVVVVTAGVLALGLLLAGLVCHSCMLSFSFFCGRKECV